MAPGTLVNGRVVVIGQRSLALRGREKGRGSHDPTKACSGHRACVHVIQGDHCCARPLLGCRCRERANCSVRSCSSENSLVRPTLPFLRRVAGVSGGRSSRSGSSLLVISLSSLLPPAPEWCIVKLTGRVVQSAVNISVM